MKKVSIFLCLSILISLGVSFAQNFHIVKDNQAELIIEKLNVYSRPPVLIKSGFLKWKWGFGRVIYVLKQGDRVRILEVKTFGHYKWAKIKYKDRATQEEKTGWCFLGSK